MSIQNNDQITTFLLMITTLWYGCNISYSKTIATENGSLIKSKKTDSNSMVIFQ